MLSARTTTVLATLWGACVLMLPVVYNGYPITWWDTWAYLEHAFTLVPRPDRLIGYSLFIRAFSLQGTLWTVAVAQNLLVSWLLFLTMRVTCGRAALFPHLALTAALTVLTALPWTSGMIMADVFAPILVLSLYALFEAEDLTRLERGVLLFLVGLSVAVHLTHLWIGLVLAGVAQVIHRLRRRGGARLRAPIAALVAGLIGIAAFNFSRTGKLTLAAGSDAFILAHLQEARLAGPLLDAHCAERDYLLCPVRDQLPVGVDYLLWEDVLHLKVWDPARQPLIKREARRLLRDSLVEEPWKHVTVAAWYTFTTFFAFKTGIDVDSRQADLVGPRLEKFMPGDVPAFRAAREQHDALPIGALRRVHSPFTYLALAATAAVLALAIARDRPRFARGSTRFLAFVSVALVTNAVLCGNLSGVSDRYQARLIWVVVLGLVARFVEWRSESVESQARLTA